MGSPGEDVRMKMIEIISCETRRCDDINPAWVIAGRKQASKAKNTERITSSAPFFHLNPYHAIYGAVQLKGGTMLDGFKNLSSPTG